MVDCADLGTAEAARRSAVSPTTAAKWWRRYLDVGIDGLHDVQRTGRPPASDDAVRRVLLCALEEPPAGAERWTTRSVADVAGVSQATVSRIRRRYFPQPELEASLLRDLATSILTYIDVHPSGCALGFHAASGASTHSPLTPRRIDVIETVVCAALLCRPLGRRDDEAAPDPPDALAVLRRAAGRLPATPAVTLIVDVELDAAARQWLSRHPEITAHSVTGDAWLGMLHAVAAAVDPRQVADLREVQRRIRQAHNSGATEFVWVEGADAPPHTPGGAQHTESEHPAGDLHDIVRGLCAAIADGELNAGDPISARHIARRAGVSPGRVAAALAQLAEEALIDKRAGSYRLPEPTPRDIVETYTARGLLGTAIARRLASLPDELPPVVDDHYSGILRCDELGLIPDCGSADLDLQDELARAADMPRIGSMFVRLTLQLRLFVTIFGLRYRYPTGEIVSDDGRILVEIRRKDPEAAVRAWRSKIDNCARYMLTHLEAPGRDGARREGPRRGGVEPE